MSEAYKPSGVLLVGSIPLSSTEEVFTTIPAALPGRLQAIPDGETGVRDNFIYWELECFPKETIQYYLGGIDPPEGHPGFTQESVKPSGYDGAALASYEKFVELRTQGTIPQGVRFQVSLPPPLNAIQGHVRGEFHSVLEPFYEQRMREALRNIIQKIPAENLALQWDLCFDVTALEYDRGRLTDPFFKPHFSPVKEGILDRMQRLCADIPPTIPLGFHLCYGDWRHKHFIEPEDTALLVDLANNLVKHIDRSVDWVHIPVPKNRFDSEYFQPLKGLEIGEARLYLGLVHANDKEGTRRRIDTARSAVQEFGVATECGMGRTPREELESILQIKREVTNPINV